MDPFEILGVEPGASDEEIKKAYRALARELHPDQNPGNPLKAEQMARVNWAYDQLTTHKEKYAARSAQEEQVLKTFAGRFVDLAAESLDSAIGQKMDRLGRFGQPAKRFISEALSIGRDEAKRSIERSGRKP